MIPSTKNKEAYASINWIIKNANSGFFVIIAQPQLQYKIARLHKESNVAIYDYANNSSPYSYDDINKWCQSLPSDINTIFLTNFNLALTNKNDIPSKEHILSFNMSRDALADKNKIWFFCMDKNTEYHISTIAYDINSYIQQKIHFENEDTLNTSQNLVDSYLNVDISSLHPNKLLSISMILITTANIYLKNDEFDNALKCLYKAKEIRQTILGDSPDTANVYSLIDKVQSLSKIK